MLVRLMARRHVVTSQTYEVDRRKLRNRSGLRLCYLKITCAGGCAGRSFTDRTSRSARRRRLDRGAPRRARACRQRPCAQAALAMSTILVCTTRSRDLGKLQGSVSVFTGKSSVRALMGAQPTSLPRPSTPTTDAMRGRALDRNDAVLDGEVDQLGTALQFERFHHLILVILDGPRRNVELGSDVLG